MKKRIITSIIILFLVALLVCLIQCTSIVVSGSSNNNYTKTDLINLINENQSIKEHAHVMATSARELGWDDNDKLIKELQERWFEADQKQQEY
jgi:hypothetical protein